MKKFYIHNGTAEQGPLSLEELRTLNLEEKTPIWHDGLEDWSNAGNIDELKSIINRQSSPPPFLRTTQLNNQPANNYDEQPKATNKNTSIYIGVTIALALLIIGWLFYQNSRTEAIIADQQIQIDEQTTKELERQRINEALTIKNRNYRNNWFNYIKAGHGTYNYSVLGGITNLSVEVANSTDYLLNEVIVDVLYIKDNGGVWKKETVILHNIPANSSESISAPDSERGTSVQVEVVGIISNKMHFCYNRDQYINKSEDPYFCRIK